MSYSNGVSAQLDKARKEHLQDSLTIEIDWWTGLLDVLHDMRKHDIFEIDFDSLTRPMCAKYKTPYLPDSSKKNQCVRCPINEKLGTMHKKCQMTPMSFANMNLDAIKHFRQIPLCQRYLNKKVTDAADLVLARLTMNVERSIELLQNLLEKESN